MLYVVVKNRTVHMVTVPFATISGATCVLGKWGSRQFSHKAGIHLCFSQRATRPLGIVALTMVLLTILPLVQPFMCSMFIIAVYVIAVVHCYLYPVIIPLSV